MKVYIGIDIGISGGLASLNEDGGILSYMVMPIQRTSKGNEVNVIAVQKWLINCESQSDSQSVIIEEPGGSKFPKMASSMAGSFHAIRAVLDMLELHYNRITPQRWQKAMLGKLPKGQTKIAALTKAKALWPLEKFLPTAKSTKPHDGLVDSLLLAEYARRNNL